MFLSYLQIAVKVLLRRKLYTFISLFGVSFTLIVLTTAFAYYEHSFRPHPPESDSDRFLVIPRFRFTSSERPGHEWSSLPGFEMLDGYMRDLEGIEALSIHSEPALAIAYSEGRKLQLQLKRTDAIFWQITDFRFIEGGPYDASQVENRNFAAVINAATRDAYFGREGVVGAHFTIDGQRFRVAGVVENVAEYRKYVFADVWVPHSTARTDGYRDNIMGDFWGTVKVRDPADIPRVKASFAEILATIPSPNPDRYDTPGAVIDTYLEDWARGAFGSPWSSWSAEVDVGEKLLMASGLTLLFMLLPAVNLININASRIMERMSEIGVRKAFGATSSALTRQFLVENLVLTLVGGVIGLLGTAAVFTVLEETGYVRHAKLSLNPAIFAAGLGFALVFGLLSGVYPAWRMSRLHPASALKGGGR